MSKQKYIRSNYGYNRPCIYLVSMSDQLVQDKNNYIIQVSATDRDGVLINDKPIFKSYKKTLLEAIIEFYFVYRKYYKKINGKDSILLW